MGGKILFFASTGPDVELPIPVDKFWRNEVTMLTSYANSPGDAREAIKLLREKKIPVEKMITHRLELKDAQSAFNLVCEAKDSVKVLLEPHKNE